MGIFSRKPQIIQAQEAPQIMADSFYGYNNYFPAVVSRQMALGVPAIKRCRDLIAGTLASVPLEYYKKSTGEKIAAPRWVEQPSKHQPLFETLYFTLDSLLHYGQSFWVITEVYAEDGRMARANWVANTRVSFITDPATNFITQYNIDGKPVPMTGLGSLITFQKDEGILGIGAQTIKAALDAQRAASVALAAYTKKSIAAALADQKAQKSLTQTLKNLGLAYTNTGVTKYIDSLQRATGVSEDELRPAFQKLLLVLGSVEQAQSALSLAMDISAGTGKDLSAVSMALAKGYSGQTTALSRLGAGLDKALLKSGDMEAITAQLSKLFAGQALTAAKTYAGQMAILSVSAKEASETIGFALINSLIDLGGQDGAKNLAAQMEATAVATSEVIAGLTVMIGKLKLYLHLVEHHRDF